MTATSALLLVSLVALTVQAQNSSYRPVEVYEGAEFFSNGDHYDSTQGKWKFFTDADPTQGSVKYADFESANNASLIGTISGGPADGSVYMGVDFTTQSTNARNSVRLESSRTYGYHLMIADIYHMPSVCGAWPSLWMLGTGADWPINGEVDYIEFVNDATRNLMSLHTKDSAILFNHTQYMTGTVKGLDCATDYPNGKLGCSVADAPDVTSSGSKFNDQSGGTFAFLFDESGFQIWFWARGSAVPADITTGTPKPSNAWGKPNGMFKGNIDWTNKFKNLKLIINTTLCGSWAGAVWVTSSCASLAPTCEEYVAKNPSAFADAYWAIKKLAVYEKMP